MGLAVIIPAQIVSIRRRANPAIFQKGIRQMTCDSTKSSPYSTRIGLPNRFYSAQNTTIDCGIQSYGKQIELTFKTWL